MPALKDPVVKFNTEFGEMGDGTDYGEFHPIAQLKKIMDYDNGGEFKGTNFECYIRTDVATKIVNSLMQIKPADRFDIDKHMMTDVEFVNKMIEFVSE